MHLKRGLGLIIAAIVIAALPALAGAQMMGGQMMGGGMTGGPMMGGPMMDHGHMEMGGGMPPFPMFLRAANLTPDQQTQVNKILSENHATFHKLFEQMHRTRRQIADKLLSSGNVTAKDLEPETRQLDQLHQQMMANAVRVALEIRAVLKPEQIKRVAEFHQKMRSLHQQMRALMMQAGPGPGEAPPPAPAK